MPFTIGGDWIPQKEPHSSKNQSKSRGPIKVREVKRGKAQLTVIFNLPLSNQELQELCKKLKSSLGCGGTVTEERIELQGFKVDAVRKFLEERGFKVSK